ncbi:MAG: hypothetical protein AAGJ83_11120, partial [Planctomycetota bacterium]
MSHDLFLFVVTRVLRTQGGATYGPLSPGIRNAQSLAHHHPSSFSVDSGLLEACGKGRREC